jgi:hypothetical protein
VDFGVGRGAPCKQAVQWAFDATEQGCAVKLGREPVFAEQATQ